ncbi:FAD/NAD(P)-binding domain-containing protein [Trichoderma camerunense]|uniref:Thioredoxin reductase n=1 Tax=Trichoderma simmonsii TaxID=1491479 RepID=A0A8G0LE63_9HYPO|nr:Thioredoxin reductase [Trichoderma simmonsii]
MSIESPVVDVLIVGGGYGGLAAASTLYRATHSLIIFDSGVFRDAKAKPIRQIPGWDGIDSSKYRAIARAELEQTGLCSFVSAEVSTLRPEGSNLWMATTIDGQTYRGKKVILATGCEEIYPDIPGYQECWVTGIFPCMYQFGYEEHGCESAGILVVDKLAGVLPQVMKLAGDTHKFARQVYLYSNGNAEVTAQLQALAKETPFVVVIGQPIVQLVKESTRAVVTVELADKTRHVQGFLVHQPYTKLAGQLPTQLGVEITPMGDIKVQHPFPATSVPGIYAAGDCASPFKNAAMAIASGVCAGNGLARELPSSFDC